MKLKKSQLLICATATALFFSLQVIAQNKVEIEFKTGEDDLAIRDASVQGNLKISINYKNGAAPTVLENANRNQNWPKNSIRRVTMPLAADVDVNNLASIQLTRSTNSNNFEDAVADNWDLKSLAVTVSVKKDRATLKYQLFSKAGNPLNRFKGGKDCNCNKTYDFITPHLLSGAQQVADTATAPKRTVIYAVFGNGGDDLRGGNDNAKIVITFKNTLQKLVANNLNNSQKWDNFTERIVSKDLLNPANLKIDDIKEIELWHTGAGGMGADNWDLDKFKLTITINGVSKILVDKAGAPLHRFTGDTRRRTFIVQ
jgi:hypothetical protein